MDSIRRQEAYRYLNRRSVNRYIQFSNMAVMYFNGVPVEDGYAESFHRYLSPRERMMMQKDIEDVEYEDLTEDENKHEEDY